MGNGPSQCNDDQRCLADAILRLAEAVEQLTVRQTAADLELRCFTPEQAADILGKTEWWVREAIRDGRIPHTNVGKSPRMTAAHIRWVQAQGERVPNQYAKPV
ncbi:helix-turn-helix domain-containing protein [Streptomyces sp. NBC_00285]|uniref:helix-turn-helix domain-containing protein n=1 Tax=Streptomyces sp. NBC_00285 TaxID=2975700 RepID=UPI002E2BEEB4|nr:helix-turn-helix domain-containing protein [Streptomyces sp. NBC_00285]